MAAFSPFFLSLLFFFLVFVWACWWLSSDNGRYLLQKIFFSGLRRTLRKWNSSRNPAYNQTHVTAHSLIDKGLGPLASHGT